MLAPWDVTQGLSAALPRVEHEADDALAMALMAERLFGPQAGPLKVGRFTVIDRLGAGGMGVVYAAYDELLDRKVALKLLHPAGLARGGDERLLREAQAMARLSHPNIVSVFEVASHGAQMVIAMEFVRGQSLDAWLAAEARDWRAVLPVLLAAGRGLAAAHRAGIVHRDYKPHNTLVGVDGGVKVADFGLARASTATEPAPVSEVSSGRRMLDMALTRDGAVVGTPAYMAPEQHAGQPCDERSDQFSFCVTAYQALYGSLPFPTSSLEALLVAIAASTCRPAPVGSPVPTWLRRAVLRGLAPDPAMRWPSMEALLDALARDPAVTRRRRVRTGLLGVGVGLLGLLGGWIASVYGPAVCPEGVAELRGVWDDERRRTVEAALLATRLPFAATTWAHLEQDLEGYATAWTDMLGDACESHRAGRQSDTQYDLRMRCLEQRRTSLATLIEVLAHTDASSLPAAALAGGALPPVATCGDLDALLTDPLRPPDDPATAPTVARVQAGLAQVRALEGTGLFARALAAADALAADAEATGHLPFVAELALYRGRSLLAGPPEAADEALTAAFRAGLRSGHDDVAIEALARRIFVRGYRFGRREDALRDQETVLALLDRVEDDGRLRGEYLNNMGAVHLGLGEWAQAEGLFVAALAAKVAAFGPDAGELVYTQANLGTLRNDLSRTGAALAALRAALAVGDRAFGATHPTVLLVRANLGMAYLKHGRPRDAEEALVAVREGAAARPDPDHVSLAFVEQQLGWLAVERRRPAAAVDHLLAAEARLQAAGGDPVASANIHVLLARCDALRGDREGALRHYHVARAALEGSVPRTHARWMELEGDLADIEASFGRHEQVLALARATRQGLPADDARATATLFRARALEHEAGALHGLGRFDEAVQAAGRARTLLEAVVLEDNPRVATVLVSLAAAEAAAGRKREALEHLERAEAIYVRSSEADLPALALLRFEHARQLADVDRGRADALARAARDVLRGAGQGFERELVAIEAWLARP